MWSRWQSGSVALLLLLALAASAPSLGQSADLTVYLKRYGEFWAAGDYSAALSEAQNFAAAAKARYGAHHESYAGALFLQAKAHFVEGQYGEAERLYKLALRIFEKRASSARDLARTLNGLGAVYEHQGNYAAAEELHKRALRILEGARDADQAVLADTIENLGNVYVGQGLYGRAEDFYRRALALREKAPGGDHTAVTQTLNLLANLHVRFGRFAAAELLLTRALVIQEKAFGPNHPDVAKTLNNFAELYRQSGRYAKAEAPQRRALAIQEARLGPHHPHVGVSLNNLATLYWTWGRYADAEPLYRRALEVQEKALGGTHPQVATSLNNLGLVYLRLGRYGEAEPLLKRALAIREKALTRDHPDIAQSLGNLAVVYRNSGRAADGFPLLRRALAMMEKTYGVDHLNVTYSLTATANAYVSLRRYSEAAPLAERALAIREKALGAGHTDVASVLKTVAQARLGANRVAPAADASRKAVGVATRALSNGAATSLGFDIAALLEYFDIHLATLHRAVVERTAGQEAVAEAFEVAQWANHSAAAAASNQTATRVAAGSDALAALVRTQQDALSELRAVDKSLLGELSEPVDKRDTAREELMRERIKALEARILRSNEQLSVDFPQYADLMNPRPLALADAQKLLDPGEALVLFHVSEQGSFVWAITADQAEWREIKLARAELDDQVRKLRASLDLTKLKADGQLFDLDVAHSLYSAVLGPVESVVRDKPHLIVVSSGALTSLPLHVLVTDQPSGTPSLRDFSAYRSAQWLMRRHAVTALASVSSLKTHRSISPVAPQSYLGVGDPILGSMPRPPGGVPSRSAAPVSVSFRRHFRDGRVRPEQFGPAGPTAGDRRRTARGRANARTTADGCEAWKGCHRACDQDDQARRLSDLAFCHPRPGRRRDGPLQRHRRAGSCLHAPANAVGAR